MLGLLQPGATYICGAWVRTSSATPETVRMTFQLDYAVAATQWRTAASGQAGTEWIYITSAFTLQPEEALTELFLIFETPPPGVDAYE